MHRPRKTPPIPASDAKRSVYDAVEERIAALIKGETDEIAVLATVACELHAAFDWFHWTGFYRTVAPDVLKIGPYQGGHGCLTIPFQRGVCGRAARTGETQIERDVTAAPDHIACSASTCSEIVVPLCDADGAVRAVLDVDSDALDAFDAVDAERLGRIAARIAEQVY